jgi:hypothetical protein
VPSVVRLVRVAEPEMYTSPAWRNGADETCTSWLPAGPMTPSMREFDDRRSATWIACAVSGSCVSPDTIRNLARGCVRLYRETKKRTHLICCCPSEAASPVSGAATPIVRVLPHAICARSAAAGEAAASGLALLAGPPA